MSVSSGEALRIAAEMADRLGDLAHGMTVSVIAERIEVGFYSHLGDPAGKIRQATKILGGRWQKNDPKKSDYNATYYRLTNTSAIEGWTVELWTQREQVCNRRQVGTRVEHVEARAGYDREVPVWEYDCTPLNAMADAALDELARQLEPAEDVF